MNSLYIKGLRIDWDKISDDSYLRNIRALKSADELIFRSPVTFFAGENGSGKSTLLEAIAVSYGFNPEGGTRNYAFSTRDSHSELHEAIRVYKGVSLAKHGYFLRAESFYNVATAEEEYSLYGGIPQHYHEKSHGESFLSLVQNNFEGKGIYILDEPEAALSPQRQLTLLAEMKRCVDEGSQFIIVTHSPILLGFPDADILSFDGEIESISYEETESYKVTSLFLNNREKLLEELFK